MGINKGDILLVKIKSLEQYGLIVEHDGIEGLILVPNIGWDGVDIQETMYLDFQCGDFIKVKVLDSETIPFNASIKHAIPEQNPWKNNHVYRKGSIHNGRVTTTFENGYLIELNKGIRAFMNNKNLAQKLVADERIKVKVLELNVNQKKIQVSFISKV